MVGKAGATLRLSLFVLIFFVFLQTEYRTLLSKAGFHSILQRGN